MISNNGEGVMGAVNASELTAASIYYNLYNPTNTLGIKGDATNNDNLDISSLSGYPEVGFVYRGKQELYQYNVYSGNVSDRGFRVSLVIW